MGGKKGWEDGKGGRLVNRRGQEKLEAEMGWEAKKKWEAGEK